MNPLVRQRYTCHSRRNLYDPASPSFIRELCIALEHRWKPEELFLLFTAYFDEADTHGPAPTIVMAVFLGHAREWEIFGRKLKAMQKKEHFSIFHATEFKAGSGEFRGWDDIKGARVLNDLTVLVRDNLTEGVTAHLSYERYLTEYRNSFTPKGISLDSQYGVCFRMILAHIIGLLLDTGKKHRLHIVVERGHRNALNTEKIFHEIKQTLKSRGLGELTGSWVVATKEEAPPLMVADFLAHTYAMMLRPGGMGVEAYPDDPEPRKSEAGLTFLDWQPNALAELKLNMQRDRLARRTYNRSQKALATLAASVSPQRKGV